MSARKTTLPGATLARRCACVGLAILRRTAGRVRHQVHTRIRMRLAGPPVVLVYVRHSLADVRACLSSIVRYTSAPFRLILLDDASRPAVGRYLRRFARDQDAVLLRNPRYCGYAATVNRGLRHSTGCHQVLLQGDTLVTPLWLDRLMHCAATGRRIGLVGPLPAGLIRQKGPPRGSDGESEADEPLPAISSAAALSAAVASRSRRVYPRVGRLGGACLLLQSRLRRRVGPLREDLGLRPGRAVAAYCRQVAEAGYELVVADDVYVDRARRRQTGAARPGSERPAGVALPNTHRRRSHAMRGIAARCSVLLARDRLVREGMMRWEGRCVALSVPPKSTGAGRPLLQQAAAMQQMGVEVRLVTPQDDGPRRPDACIAVLAGPPGPLENLRAGVSAPVRACYVSGAEAWCRAGQCSMDAARLAAFLREPGWLRFVASPREQRAVRERFGAECFVLRPAVNLELFQPLHLAGGRRRPALLHVAVRLGGSNFGDRDRQTIEVLQSFCRGRPKQIELTLFGGGDDAAVGIEALVTRCRRLPGLPPPPKLAAILNRCDILLDPSGVGSGDGLALEGMACGAAVVAARDASDGRAARHGASAMWVDPASPEDVLKALETLADDPGLRRRIQRRAIAAVRHYSLEAAAYRTLHLLFGGATSWSV